MCLFGFDTALYLVGAATVIWIILKLSRREEVYPADVAILHQTPRGPWAPSFCPFAIKLETYFRMAKIPYQNHFTMKLSSKGKIPWMTYNGLVMADSQFCIQYLNKTLNKDLNGHLSKEERAIGRAFQKLSEEHLYWSLVYYRWINKDSWEMTLGIIAKNLNYVFKYIFPWIARIEAWGQGMGRHTLEEATQIGIADMEALSDYLGDKPFFTGDEPCEFDCAIFGILANLKYHFWESPFNKAFIDMPNLAKYCERMQEQFWPDWEECHTAGNTKDATK